MESFAGLLDSARYVYNPYALPQFVCALLTFAMGLYVVVREDGSRLGTLYLSLIVAISLWFFSYGLAYSAVDSTTADQWLRIGQAGVAFIPAIALTFAGGIVRPPEHFRWLLAFAWIGSSAFAFGGLAVSSYFGEPYRYAWGYYVRFTPYSALYVPFLVVSFATTLALYRHSFRTAHGASTAARRSRMLFLAFALGSLGIIDVLPAFGVALYPFGCVPVALSIAFATYITARYRLMDITPELAAKQILQTINDGLVVLDDDGVVQVANDTLLGMIGLPREEVVGRRLPRGLRSLLSPGELASIRAGVPMHNREIEYRRPDGTQLTLSFAVSVLRTHGSRPVAYVCALRDITEQKRTENRIRFLAYYDNLTGLPNRQQFQEQLRAALAAARSSGRMVALLFLDVDRFKRINDTLGHAQGDALLQAVAGRLVGCVRRARGRARGSESAVARLGGDEFIVALHDLETQEEAARVAERVLAAVCDPIRLEEQEVTVTASLGISVYPHDGDDVEALMKNADAAMYQAKEAGRNSFFFYDRAMNAAMLNRLALEARLRKALDNGTLSLHYQPQLAMQTGDLMGVEALLRWNDPELGAVPPERFIPIAEDSGLILLIGDWVLRAACTQARAWLDAGLPLGRIAVNLSGRQFRDRELLARVREALDAARLDPGHLELELTESVVMQDALQTRRTLEALKSMGVHLSIDDFGTGYSSLSYLRSFPIDTLKIDRSFVHDIAVDGDTDAIVAAIIAMAHSLKLGVVGEGVETEEQGAFLRAQGCRLVQGFLYCEPLPAAGLEQWLRTRAARVAP